MREPDCSHGYSDGDLRHLQQVLIGRDLGLSLKEIRRWLDDPNFDRRAAIEARRATLAVHAARAESLLQALDAALEAIDQVVDDEDANVDMNKIREGFDRAKDAHEVG